MGKLRWKSGKGFRRIAVRVVGWVATSTHWPSGGSDADYAAACSESELEATARELRANKDTPMAMGADLNARVAQAAMPWVGGALTPAPDCPRRDIAIDCLWRWG